MVNGSLALKTNLASVLGINVFPKLQIAKTGFSTGEENVIVSVNPWAPFTLMAAPLGGGWFPTVPPTYEVVGIQLG